MLKGYNLWYYLKPERVKFSELISSCKSRKTTAGKRSHPIRSPLCPSKAARPTTWVTGPQARNRVNHFLQKTTRTSWAPVVVSRITRPTISATGTDRGTTGRPQSSPRTITNRPTPLSPRTRLTRCRTSTFSRKNGKKKQTNYCIIFYHANRNSHSSLFFFKLSYLGNWNAEPEKPIVPCSRQLLGRGPIQDFTTNKHDFTWKRTHKNEPTKPKGNLTFSDSPLECEY